MNAESTKILLLSAYDAQSHRYWRQSLVKNIPEIDWTVFALPDRHFYWRVRSNALTFWQQHSDSLTQSFDLVLATSMVDCASLRGFFPALGKLPWLVYFHENQFAYPLDKPSGNIVSAQFGSIMNALIADKVIFNSAYNRDTFFEGAGKLLKRMPDGVSADVLAQTEKQSLVLPVPISDQQPEGALSREDRLGPVQLVWNHRWEYDKQPEVFFAALETLSASGAQFGLHVMGKAFRESPACFEKARTTLAKHIITWGFQEEESYRRVLRQADLVVSSALHDFQGLSMLEAIAAGCIPVAPDRVAYPDYVPASLRYSTEADEVGSLSSLLRPLLDRRQLHNIEAVGVQNWRESVLIPQYKLLFSKAANGEVSARNQ